MSKVLWVTAAILFAILAPVAVMADDTAFPAAMPHPIASGPGADMEPVMAVSPQGQVWVAWKHAAPDGSQAELLLASSPDWVPAVVTPVDPDLLPQTSMALKAESGVMVTWSYPLTATQAVFQKTWTPEAPAESRTWSLPLNARWTVNGQGAWHSAWVEKGAIRTVSSIDPLTITLPISPTAIVTDLTLAIDGAGGAHLAWTLRSRADKSLGIYYAPVISGTQPIRVASGGQVPKLILGPTGRAHLFWIDDEGLQYASSVDWAAASLVSPGFPVQRPVALAVGADEGVHLVWTDGQTLWRAHSADWRASLERLPTPADCRDLAAAVDRFGRLHLAWVSQDPDDERDTDLAYLRPLSYTPQVAVSYPQDGDVLVADAQARVVLNGPDEEILRIEFYLQADSGAEASRGALRSLGIDRDGTDGWRAPLRVRDLEPWLRFRVLALATGTEGAMTQAWGGWFTVQRPDRPGIWFEPMDYTIGHGDAHLSVLLAAQPGQLHRLDLYLAPVAGIVTDTVQEVACPPSSSYYLGSYEPSIQSQWPAAEWQQFTYDSRHIPDGRYRPVAIGIDGAGHRVCERGSHWVTIEDAMAPHIEITEPARTTIVDRELRMAAQAGDDNGTVRRVDFYLERPDLLLQAPGAASRLGSPEMLWLGSDKDGSDGWGLNVPVRPEMDGDDWRVQAMAYDDEGLNSVARSPGTVTILGRQRPFLGTLLPSAGSRLWGIQSISLFVTKGLAYLAQADLYIESSDRAWTYLGAMADADDRLTYDWNTRDWPDGDYALIVVAQDKDGHRSWLRRPDLHVQNGSSLYLFRSPAAGQVLSGTTFLTVAGGPSALPLVEARFYYRLPGGALAPIAKVMAGVTPKRKLITLWHTDTVLDGDYELTSILVDAQGTESRASVHITVHNLTPLVSFQDTHFSSDWAGSRQISWQAASPAGRPVSVTIEYSPDDGSHWLNLGREITATNVFTWRTDAYPDSSRARLRLSATDGVLAGKSASPLFAVNNDNEPPQISLLRSPAGRPYGGQVPIAWRAVDPDGDELRIDVAYRRGAGEWISLAQGMRNLGRLMWDTQALPPADDYEVRVTAVDARSASTADSATGVRLETNKLPEVLLMWPHGGTRLEKEAVILWRATDADNDELRIDLYYSDNAGQTWIPLAEDVPNTGYYQWQVSYLPPGTEYRVRVMARDRCSEAEDRSDGNFSIGRQVPTPVRLVSPAPGTEVRGIQLVHWSRSNTDLLEAQATLLVRPVSEAAGAAQNWIPIASNMPDDGFYLWNTRGLADGKYDLKLLIRHGDSEAASALPQPLVVKNGGNRPPQISLLAPLGGELWSGWREIRWQAWDGNGDAITATVSISSDAGQHWTSIVRSDARAGQALWDTHTVPSAESYWLRLTATDGQATTQAISAAPVHIANGPGYPPSIFLPSAQISASTDRRIPVPWVAEDIDGDSLTMGMALSEDGGLSWREVANDLFDAGQYTLEEKQAPLDLYLLRLRADDGVYQVESFSTPSPVRSSADVSLELQSPRGGEHWSGEQEIRWHANTSSAPTWAVDIEWSRDGAQTWTSLASGLRQAASFRWDTRTLPNGVYFLRLALRTEQGTARVTSEPLTVDNPGRNNPVISLLAPHGGETWWGTREVRWRATDADGDTLTISLSYSVDRGATWTAMAFPSSNTGSYIWDTTAVPNADEVWLRATANDGQAIVEDISDGPVIICNHHAPTVALLSPAGNEEWAGLHRIVWLATREGERPLQVTIQVSTDGGRAWQTLAEGLSAQGNYLWDTSALPNRSRVLVRVLATDGAHRAVDMVHRPVILSNHSQPAVPFFLP